MKHLIILLLAAFPLGQLARLSIPGTEIVLHPNDFIVAFVVFLGLLVKRKNLIIAITASPMTKPLFLFAGAVLVSLVFNLTRFSPQQLLSSALYPMRFFVYAGLFYVFSSLKQEEKNLTNRWLLVTALIVTAFGLVQYIFVPNVAFLSALDWDDHYYRLIGSFLDPGFTGAILTLGLVFVYLNKPSPRFPPFVSLPTSFVLFIIYSALALTYSRASYLMYLVSFAALAFYRKSLKIFLIAALVMAITIPLLPKTFGEGTKLSRENSILVRIKNWGISFDVWRRNPVVGTGFNTYRYVVGVESQSHSGGADSSILLVLATSGLIGFLAYLNLLRVMWNTGASNLLFKTAFLGILAHSWFNNTLFYPWVMEWLWITLAVSGQQSAVRENTSR